MEIAEILSQVFSQKFRECNGNTNEITRVGLTIFFSVRENISVFNIYSSCLSLVKIS